MKPNLRKLLPTPFPRGMSLIELMVALVLGLFLIAGIIQLFIGTRVTYMSNESLARVQENGRFAIDALRTPIREANSRGFCGGEIPIRNHLNQTCSATANLLYGADTAIAGWEYDGTAPGDDDFELDDLDPAAAAANDWRWRDLNGDLQTGLLSELTSPNRAVKGSDVLVVRRLVPIPNLTANPAGGHTSGNDFIVLNGAHGHSQNSVMMVTDCTFADIFQNRTDETSNQFSRDGGTCANPGPGNIDLNWSTQYDDQMLAFAPRIMAYYVGYNADRQEPGLYVRELSQGVANAQSMELVEGVENMQILYGYSYPGDSGGDGQSVNEWLAADQVPDWGLITAVHVAMIVRSPDTAGSGGPDEPAFDLAGTRVTVQVDSNRLRHPVQSTIGLRNRYLVD